ncbi:GFA family protein [Geminicoccaceae bacterium 1502E]|nr:GFA family protein [Geminicoccaceae bacterium 1502E]
MRLEGSFCCGAVRFSMEAYAPVPYQRCYCSVCRKTAGGHAVSLGAWAGTLDVQGEESIRRFHAVIGGQQSPAEQSFCGRCGSPLWLRDSRWPDLRHPFASAIDAPLPTPPESGPHDAGLPVRLGAPRRLRERGMLDEPADPPPR